MCTGQGHLRKMYVIGVDSGESWFLENDGANIAWAFSHPKLHISITRSSSSMILLLLVVVVEDVVINNNNNRRRKNSVRCELIK